MWTKKGGLGAADQIRRNRPNNMTLDNWNKLVDSRIDPKKAHGAEVNSRNRLANKIVSLQGSRSLAQSRHRYYPSLIQSYYDLHTKEGIWRDDGSKALYEEMLRLQALGTMTDQEILAQVLGGKQRGHLPGIGRKIAGVETSTVFGSQDKGTPFYSKREMNEVMVEFLSQTQGVSQLATMFPSSTTEVGSTSGTTSASEDPSPSRNVDPYSSGSLDGDDEDDGDHAAALYREIFFGKFLEKNLENLHNPAACCQNCAVGFGEDMSSLKIPIDLSVALSILDIVQHHCIFTIWGLCASDLQHRHLNNNTSVCHKHLFAIPNSATKGDNNMASLARASKEYVSGGDSPTGNSYSSYGFMPHIRSQSRGFYDREKKVSRMK
ncbi:hypothetical protein Tco_0915262 [Tanacetum coccineum]